jgi:hypothetical protein
VIANDPFGLAHRVLCSVHYLVRAPHMLVEISFDIFANMLLHL